MPPDDVRRVYLDGVAAVEAITSEFDAMHWDALVCGSWTATETVRHLVAVANWYHEWLDRAIAGESAAPFAASEIDAQTASSLRSFAHLDGPTAVGEFSHRAQAYLDRVTAHWDVPYAYPFGDVTAGLHAGVAAAEWHLHAWDLSRAAGVRHEPGDPATLFVAAGRCVAAAEGGIKGAVLERIVPLAARRGPWSQMLRRSGRSK